MRNLIEESIEKLDQRFASWDLYRTASKEWVVRVVSKDGRTETVRSKYLGDALFGAEDATFLTAIPRRPKPISADQFTVSKDGHLWAVSGPAGNWTTKTKKHAMLTIEKAVGRNAWAINNWDETFGSYADKTEGVDFVYSEH